MTSNRPEQSDSLHTYWCEKCQSWTMFQFEDWNMCDECALCEVFSDSDLDDMIDNSFSTEELKELNCEIRNS